MRRSRYYQIDPALQSLIRFEQSDLRSRAALGGVEKCQYDVIFCRNVLIYLPFEEQLQVVRMLDKSLAPGGYLMLGDAESLHLYEHNHQMVDAEAGLIYQKPAATTFPVS